MRVTLKEISEKTGVSAAALSRVLNGHGYVSAALRERAEAALQAYGYRRAMPRQTNENAFANVVLLITGGLGHTYQRTIESFCEEAKRSHRRILVAPTEYDAVTEKEYMRFAQRAGLYGVIMTSVADRKETADLLRELRSPVVLIARSLSIAQTDVVTQDNYGMGRAAGAIFMRYGHTKIAYLGGQADSTITKEKLEGLRDVLREKGLSLAERDVAYGRLDIPSGEAYAAELLRMEDPPTAVFCSNDLMAIGIAEALKRSGLSVPGDLSLAACDRTAMSDLYAPHIHRFYIDWRDAARVAFSMLEQRKKDPDAPYKRYTFDTRICPGESLAPPRSGGFRAG